MPEIEYITTIKNYCKHIQIHPARHEDFDARTFDENMPTVKRKVEPFRHEFYAIGLLLEGTSHNWHGINNMKANVIFNSPYQLISWDIENDWCGFYLLFTQNFLMRCHFAGSLLTDFPFLKLDQVKPISTPQAQVKFLQTKFEQIIDEYNSDNADKFKFIESYLNLLLLSIKRFSEGSQAGFFASEQNRKADIKLVARYQALIESCLNKEEVDPNSFATSWYADQLAIHPNHLNTIVKRITGNTAKQMIQEKVIIAAKALLKQSSLSIKEIAWRLGYEEATHFSSFFKKETRLTPVQYKQLSGI